MKTIAVSGGFDPLHMGHIRLFRHAASFGKLIVILNSDEWLARKKGMPFMKIKERMEIIKSIKYVSAVYEARDEDNTVCESLKELKPDIFANGGDRVEDNVPEKEVCERLGIQMLYGIGGKKVQSSSWLTSKVEKSKGRSITNG